MEKEQAKNYFWIALIIILVIGGGLFILNQLFDWKYRVEFLLHPCDLCIELNPDFTYYPDMTKDIIGQEMNMGLINFTIGV